MATIMVFSPLEWGGGTHADAGTSVYVRRPSLEMSYLIQAVSMHQDNDQAAAEGTIKCWPFNTASRMRHKMQIDQDAKTARKRTKVSAD